MSSLHILLSSVTLTLVFHVISVHNLSLVFTKYRRDTVSNSTEEGDEQIFPTTIDPYPFLSHYATSENSSILDYDTNSGTNERAACKCVDALQNCDVIMNPIYCCMVKPIANMSCQKSCQFCYDMQVPGVPGGVPGIPIPAGVPGQDPPVMFRDPCNPQVPAHVAQSCSNEPNFNFTPSGGNPNPSFPGTGQGGSNNGNPQISQTINIPQNNQG